MKKFFFILSFFSCIRAMQETEKKLALLPPEMLEEMRQKKVKKDAYSTHINFDKPVIFSTNHTQIHYSETPEEQPCFNVLGWHDLASGLMNFEYNKDENQRLNNIVAYDIKCTNDVHMDGPNDSGCIIIGTNRAIESPDGDTIDYKSNYCLVSRHNAKKNTHVCWCNPQNARFERVQFRSDPKLCAITALALYKKTNVFSVIIQVLSFRLLGRRIFKMAPIHHHFELLGWQESKITVRFGIISLILCLIALMTLKIR
jgi:hypothetical protein